MITLYDNKIWCVVEEHTTEENETFVNVTPCEHKETAIFGLHQIRDRYLNEEDSPFYRKNEKDSGYTVYQNNNNGYCIQKDESCHRLALTVEKRKVFCKADFINS